MLAPKSFQRVKSSNSIFRNTCKKQFHLDSKATSTYRTHAFEWPICTRAQSHQRLVEVARPHATGSLLLNHELKAQQQNDWRHRRLIYIMMTGQARWAACIESQFATHLPMRSMTAASFRWSCISFQSKCERGPNLSNNKSRIACDGCDHCARK